LRHPHRRRQDREHRLHRLRAGAHRAGAVPHARLRPRGLARGRPHAAPGMIAAFRSIDPDAYVPHALHRDGRGWMETNCYVDVWLELLHALGLDPVACLAFTTAIDFEGDQWTFYKPSLSELWDAYGLDTQELQPWRGPLESAVEQVGRGR